MCGARVATAQTKTVVRFGHFPNITHAQGVIAHALSRQGKGWFEKYLEPNVEIQWFTYNAGPSAMEAIFAKSLGPVAPKFRSPKLKNFGQYFKRERAYHLKAKPPLVRANLV